MATSDVEIGNRALQKLGAKRILTLTDDSVNARAVNAAFNPVKLAELEEHDWVCATKRAEIAADGTAPAWGKANSFTLPPDFVRLANDYPEDNLNSKDWQIEGKKIFTDDAAPLYIRYIYNVTDPNEMSPLLREAISARLALELCEEITQSNTKKAALEAEYKDIIARAKKSNAVQSIPVVPAEDTWITCRS